ncbi:Dyp-type peroxidase [Providencia vermicola]|uniref:Dyp-type peroxidase n=2 Tax=Providencia TaxID=586 RepID=A0AAI9I2F2_PROST|nr:MULTISPECIES: Dyp-type peroxidase [Providencia]ELR5037216.1 Dyp-type peroxidase [Providencia stuartii]ELR5119435.1 Dyp-type peroxidase [Providencia stuartii]ELX8378315.1 Dyp-type peroxidase [Providencia stuartii]EMD5257522.1 Dyp-type peroxidase [Providencia stuartii]QIC15540.1 Dyp-type peroxidase [Providencia vermicola]
MSHSQSGILKDHSRFGIFIEAMVQGPLADIKTGCQRFVDALTQLQEQYPSDRLGAVIAFGSDIWKQLSAPESAPELKPFRQLGKGLAPATQRDLFIHIQSQRHDINFSLAQAALKAFGPAIKVEEEIHGFRWVEERDLSGFIDGTENPQGEEIAEVALIADGIDKGGSYILVQRYEHSLHKWDRFSEQEQEKMIGRTKSDSVELDESERNVTSHVSRVVVEEDGEELSIMRHSLPYGTASGKHGLYFLAYCARLHNIEQQLLSMFGEKDGKYDDLLRMTKAVSGSYYFAPSIDTLLSL